MAAKGSGLTAARWLVRHAPPHGLLVALIAMYAIFWVVFPAQFGSVTNLRVIAGTQAIIVFLAIAVIFPLRAGDFDLSIAASMGLAAAVVGVLLRDHVVAIPGAIAIALAAAALVGVLNAVLVVGVGLPPFIVTLGTLIGVQGVAIWVGSGQLIVGLPTSFIDIFSKKRWGFPQAAWMGWGIAIVAWYIFDQTRFGRHLLFVGWNRSAAERAAVRVGRVRFVSFVISAVISGFAGVSFAGLVGSVDSNSFSAYLIPPYAAAFLGTAAVALGRFNVGGTLIGIYLLAVSVDGFQMLGADFWISQIFNGGALLAAITIARLFSGKSGALLQGPV